MGRHGPPTPDPGMFMSTLGWVFASFTTSVTSTPCCSQIRASWFAKAMFMSRNAFSRVWRFRLFGPIRPTSLGFQQTLLWRFRALFFLGRRLSRSFSAFKQLIAFFNFRIRSETEIRALPEKLSQIFNLIGRNLLVLSFSV